MSPKQPRKLRPSLLLVGALALACVWTGLSLRLAAEQQQRQQEDYSSTQFHQHHHHNQNHLNLHPRRGTRRHLGAASIARTSRDHRSSDTATHAAASPPASKPKCALLFFGAPRLFRSVVLPSIRKQILGPNPGCDVFVHTYNATLLSSERSGEANQTLRPTDVLGLAPLEAVLEPPELLSSARNLSFYRENHHTSWGPCCGSTDNMIKQWHSIEGVWDLMEKHAAAQQQQQNSEPHIWSPSHHGTHYYERVGLFRSDVFYTHPIEVEGSTEEAVVPDWVFKGRRARTGEHLLNDRMFYGTYENARVWAKGRFPFAPRYLEHYRYATEGRRQGLHSESFLHSLLVKAHRIDLTLRPLCFWRTRANGMVMAMDCEVPGSGELRDPSDWALLQDANATCCWECWRMDIRPGQYGPCTPETQKALRPEPSRSAKENDH